MGKSKASRKAYGTVPFEVWKMNYMSKWLLLFGILTCVQSALCLAADRQIVNITVVADQTKVNGEPWDGLPGLSGGRGSVFIPLPNTNAPPDLAICIVRFQSEPQCLIRREADKQFSFCQNSYDCTFRRVAIPDDPFGLIILDLDLQRHDLVDFALLTPESTSGSADLTQLEEEVRGHVERLAPAFFEGERQRRKRETLVIPLERCMGSGRACKLVQSELRMNWAD
ncbi:hypothetical protein HL666_20090 [Bradyrhizobium sp. 83002]|uniref:hypothetical protein n=1 Tax=Bradyrhizobium aeschynomenes TaxID=2734909 RepID=UPI001554EB1A|nr:hypothetical protein [Bradyrhizobium aeschynomenes]NPU13074.1 hypothetical protein [Bradyrhizobium aeschynomenes]